MTNFVLWGNGPCTNRGCEAILRSTVRIVSHTFKDVHFMSCHGSRSRPTDEELFKHPLLKHRKPILKSLSTPCLYRIYERAVGRVFRFESYAKTASAVLALGGDNFSTDYHEMPYRYFSSIKRAHEREIPFVVWGVSTGHLNPGFEDFGLKMFKLADLIATRESISYAYLQDKGLPNVCLVADPAFVMAAKKPANADSVEKFLDRFPVIGLNVSPLYGRFFPGGREAWRNCCANIIVSLLKHTSFGVLLIPHVFNAGNNDETFMRGLAEELHPRNERVKLLLGHKYTAEELKWLIGKVDFFIGARTHATIAAFSQAIPTISLGYSVKALGINKDIFGHTDWVLPPESVNPDGVLSRLKALVQQNDEIRRHYGRVLPEYCDRAWRAGSHLKRVLAGISSEDLHLPYCHQSREVAT